MSILFLVLTGLGIGVISGTLGIGGGVLLVPLLMWVFDYEQKEAAGITLAVLAVPVVLPAVWQYYVRDVIRTEHLITAGWIAAGFAVGGLAGGYLIKELPLESLRFLFGLMLIWIAVRFLMVSDSEVARALTGLGGVAVGWLAYVGLRALGRKYPAKPDFAETMRALPSADAGSSDYSI